MSGKLIECNELKRHNMLRQYDILEQLIALMKEELDEQEYADYINELIYTTIKFVNKIDSEKGIRLRKILKEI